MARPNKMTTQVDLEKIKAALNEAQKKAATGATAATQPISTANQADKPAANTAAPEATPQPVPAQNTAKIDLKEQAANASTQPAPAASTAKPADKQ